MIEGAVVYRYWGHAMHGLQVGGYELVVDAFMRDNPSFPAGQVLSKVDYILVTHGHYDHVGDVVELAGATGAHVIANWEIGDWLVKQGVEEGKVHG